jgi:TPR repeat protein
MLAQSIFPILISDTCSGAVMPLPLIFWPESLRQNWLKSYQEKTARDISMPGVAGKYVPDPELAHLCPMSFAEEGLLWFRESDYEKARNAWEKSAATGNAAGLRSLGMLYEEGKGVEPDLQRALTYFQQAVNKGDSSSQKNVVRLRQKLGLGMTGIADEVPDTSLNQDVQPRDIQELLAEWEAIAIPLAESRWGKTKIKAYLKGNGCPPKIAAQAAQRAKQKVQNTNRRRG